jgi:hypothetical protein
MRLKHESLPETWRSMKNLPNPQLTTMNVIFPGNDCPSTETYFEMNILSFSSDYPL